MLPPRSVKLVGAGMSRLGKLGVTPTQLMMEALQNALSTTPGIKMRQLGGLVAVPSLAAPHFMEAHYLATKMGLLPNPNVVVRTIDTGGAGPVTGLLEAVRMIRMEWCDVAAVVAGDAVSSLDRVEFLKRADQTCQDLDYPLPSPVIPHGYDRIAQWQMQTYGVTREQLAMCSVLMSMQAANHPQAMTRSAYSLDDVLQSPRVASVTSVLECARRADGGGAIILASDSFLKRNGIELGPDRDISVIGGGEASGPLYPPRVIDEDMFSCERAADLAYEEARLSVNDIDFFGLYDCFPICLLRAIEAVGLADKGHGGRWIERVYNKAVANAGAGTGGPVMNINTHGGLLAFGAPWEVPAIFNIIEAYAQLTNQAASRQLPNARRALVYGNGGIFSASAVAILANNTAAPASQ